MAWFGRGKKTIAAGDVAAAWPQIQGAMEAIRNGGSIVALPRQLHVPWVVLAVGLASTAPSEPTWRTHLANVLTALGPTVRCGAARTASGKDRAALIFGTPPQLWLARAGGPHSTTPTGTADVLQALLTSVHAHSHADVDLWRAVLLAIRDGWSQPAPGRAAWPDRAGVGWVLLLQWADELVARGASRQGGRWTHSSGHAAVILTAALDVRERMERSSPGELRARPSRGLDPRLGCVQHRRATAAGRCACPYRC